MLRLFRLHEKSIFPGNRNAKLETWCRKEANRFDATIDDEAIQYLIEGTESNLRQMSSEIGKSATLILPAKRITLDVVVQMSPHHSHVFVLADCWLTGKGAEALESVQEIQSRQSAMPVLAAMQTMLSKWIHMKALCDKFNSELPGGREFIGAVVIRRYGKAASLRDEGATICGGERLEKAGYNLSWNWSIKDRAY